MKFVFVEKDGALVWVLFCLWPVKKIAMFAKLEMLEKFAGR